MIKITALHTATPPLALTQKEALSFILKYFSPRPAIKKLYEKILRNEGIKQRHFSLDKIEDVLETDLDIINRRFEQTAVSLCAESLLGALKKSKINPNELDFLAVSTCTGYLCPGLAAQLIGTCKLRKDIRYIDVVGMGCGSAIPAMEQCHNFLKAYPKAIAASVSTEICSSAIFIGDAPDLVVSNGIFGDGSAAVILRNTKDPGIAELQLFHSLTYPKWKETLRFRTEKGHLRNVLGKEVPHQAGESVRMLTKECLSKLGLESSAVTHWILHSGGTKVLDEIQKCLHLTDSQLTASRTVLKNFGNISSPTVLFVLNNILETSPSPKPNELGLMIAFGAGFSVHGCALRF